MEYLKHYLPLCWFKTSLDELPRSFDFLKKNLYFYVSVEFFIQANLLDDPTEAFFEVLIETSFTLFFVAALLYVNRTFHTFIQVATAFLFCENIVSFVGIPIVIWLTITDDPTSYYALGVLLLWDISVIAYLIKQILNVTPLAGAVVSLCYFFLTYVAAFFIMN